MKEIPIDHLQIIICTHFITLSNKVLGSVAISVRIRICLYPYLTSCLQFVIIPEVGREFVTFL